ncbi:MAG TPA: hypothetical protein VFK17_07840 [Gaiellaceae bacterium]|nr:hypothetical protein [Gaiellaceae bacterium]
MRRWFVLAATALAAVALAAGCGGGAGAPAGATGGAAAVVPADSVAFVAIDSDLGSSQWQALDGLLGALPGGDSLVATLRKAVEQKGSLSWADDVQPALGPELDLAVLPATGGKAQAVLLTQPPDPSKLDALLAKLAARGTTAVSAQVGDWTAVSESQAALDAVSSASSQLADSTPYRDASAKLADDALVRAFANGAEARRLVAALGGTLPAGGERLDWAAADAVAASGGLKVDGFVRSEGGTTAAPYDAALLQKIPSGQLLVADFQATHDTTLPVTSAPLLGALGKVAQTLGGETAVYVTPASPLPAVTLVTESSDPEATVSAIEQALADAGKSASGSGLGTFLGALALSHATVGSDLVVSTSQQQVDAFRSGGAKLADDSAFRAARSASGMPDRTTGFVYVNLKDAASALSGLSSLGGGSGTRLALPAALQSLTAYGTGSDGGVSGFTVYLAGR